VVDFYSGLVAIDISNPASPHIVGVYGVPVDAVAIAGDYAYVMEGTSGLQVIDVSDPANPHIMCPGGTTAIAYGVAVAGDYVYVAGYSQGLQVLAAFQPLAGISYVDSGTLTATVPSGQLPGVWDLQVTNSDGGHAVLHNAFTVNVPTTLTLLSPNGGEEIPSGSTYTIRWSAPPEAVKFKLQYSKDNGKTWILIASNVTGTSYNWPIPIFFDNKKQCLVKVKAFNSSGVQIGKDVSDSTFTIEVVKLTSPDGGETLTRGTQHTITWTTNNTKNPVTSVKLTYTTNGGSTWILIDTPTGNSGSYNWTVPNVPSSSCKVKVVLKDASGTALGKDASDGFFTIQ
jgi:hypothetical protein